MQKKFLKRGFYLLLFTLLLCFFGSKIKTVPYQPDESHWIASSAVFEAYFTGDFVSHLWDKSYMTVTQPPLPRYVIGFGRWIGGFGEADLNLPWEFDRDSQTNIAEGRMPSQPLLWWSRLPMVFLAAASMFIGFLLMKRFAGRITGYIWIIMCLLSIYFPKTLIRAMGDSALLFCISGIVFISYLLLEIADNQELNKMGRLYIYFLGLGIAIGLAESAKLNGLSAIMAGFVFAAIVAFRMKRTRTLKIRFALMSFLILIFSSQLTFIVLNPFLWKNPLDRTLTMFNSRVFEMSVQTIDFPESRIQGFGEHISVLTERIFENHASIRFDGALWINIFFFLIGFVFLTVKAFQYFRYRHSNPGSVVILAVGLAASIPSLFTPLDWDRYYLFPIYFSTMAIVIGIGLFGRYGYRFVLKRISTTEWHKTED